jgi:sugar/nucleoside kinase (ribokinase family)
LTEPQRATALLAIELARRYELVVTWIRGLVCLRLRWFDRACFPAVQILLPNLHEAQRLSGAHLPEACARALMDAGVKIVP